MTTLTQKKFNEIINKILKKGIITESDLKAFRSTKAVFYLDEYRYSSGKYPQPFDNFEDIDIKFTKRQNSQKYTFRRKGKNTKKEECMMRQYDRKVKTCLIDVGDL